MIRLASDYCIQYKFIFDFLGSRNLEIFESKEWND